MARKTYNLPHSQGAEWRGRPVVMPGKQHKNMGNSPGKAQGGYGTRFGSPPRKSILYLSDFSTGDNGWVASQGSVSGNIDSIGGQDDNLRFNMNAALGSHNIKKEIFPTGTDGAVEYKVAWQYYIPSTNTTADGIFVDLNGSGWIDSGAAQDTWLSAVFYVTPESTGFLTISATETGAPSDGRIFTPTAGDLLYIRNVEVRRTN